MNACRTTLKPRCLLNHSSCRRDISQTDQADQKLGNGQGRLRNFLRCRARVLRVTAGRLTNRGTHWTILPAAWGFNSRSRLHHPAADTSMQAKHKRQHRDKALAHSNHVKLVSHSWQESRW